MQQEHALLSDSDEAGTTTKSERTRVLLPQVLLPRTQPDTDTFTVRRQAENIE